MKALRLALLFCAVTFACQSNLHAAGWSWWPWGGNEPAAAAKKPAPKKSSTMLSRAGSSTRSFFKKTGEALTPKKKSKTVSQFPSWGQDPPVKKTSNKSRSRRQKEEEEKGSWLGNMFGPEKEPAPPRTAQEFLALPRPGEDF